MKATGIVRRIDDLGRIVIPREIRKQLKIGESDPVEIFLSRDGEIILKPYRTNYTLRKADDWEELENPQGNVVAQGHRLSAEEVLSALGVEFQTEELESDEEEDQSSSFSIPAPRQRTSGAVFHYTTTSINLSSGK